ncbi:hypothetical protein LXL04_013882 [Taraxacum kok-saghyz]
MASIKLYVAVLLILTITGTKMMTSEAIGDCTDYWRIHPGPCIPENPAPPDRFHHRRPLQRRPLQRRLHLWRPPPAPATSSSAQHSTSKYTILMKRRNKGKVQDSPTLMDFDLRNLINFYAFAPTINFDTWGKVQKGNKKLIGIGREGVAPLFLLRTPVKLHGSSRPPNRMPLWTEREKRDGRELAPPDRKRRRERIDGSGRCNRRNSRGSPRAGAAYNRRPPSGKLVPSLCSSFAVPISFFRRWSNKLREMRSATAWAAKAAGCQP